MNCVTCGEGIPPERLEILPHAETCVRCSTEPRAVGFQIYAHKTAGEVFILRGDDTEGIRQARAVYERKR
jgi:hypothetical protein